MTVEPLASVVTAVDNGASANSAVVTDKAEESEPVEALVAVALVVLSVAEDSAALVVLPVAEDSASVAVVDASHQT